MEDRFEKKVKVYLPYVIIIAVVYLLFPSILVLTGQDKNPTALTELIYVGVFPVTALVCSTVFSYKNKNELPMAFVAPVLYIPSALLYGNIRANVVTTIIYIVSYFICGFLGLLLGDILKAKNGKENSDNSSREKQRVSYRKTTASHVSRRAREEQTKRSESIKVKEEPYTYDDPSTTENDIDAILKEIHERQKRQ